MSLIPYHPREGNEIVLRHRNAIVVRNPSSRRLEIRGLQLTECPTCHQPLRPSSPERPFEPSAEHDSYVDPDYFRMLRAGRRRRHTETPPPSSPIRRLVGSMPVVEDAPDDRRYNDDDEYDSDHDNDEIAVQEAEFVSSTPAVPEGSRIRREAFSPNYFSTFFIEERELGRGGKGVVLLVRHEIDGCSLGHFACKRVPVGDDHAWLEKVLVEVELLAKLSHPNLVSYRHVWLEDVKLNRFGPSVACAFILQQYCNGGDLLHYVVGTFPKEATKEELKAQMRRRSKGQADRPQGPLHPQRRLPFEDIYSLFKDITSGLAYLHGANYIHRDLKPSNCLLHREGSHITCLISDFGEVQPENMVRKSTGSTGTISYCAPEVLRNDPATGGFGNFTAKSDIFSLGMILYFMCFGRLPYQSANTINEELEDIDQLRAEITDWKGFQDERRERPDLPSRLYQLLKRLLALNPAERPSASEVLAAMKSESSLDGVTRGPGPRSSSPSIGLAGRRIQNLDSPVPPGTPVADPSKQPRVASSSEEDLSTIESHPHQRSLQANPHNHAAGNPSSPRNRGHRHGQSLRLSHGQDGYSRTGSRSPERSLGGGTASRRGSSPPPSPVATTPLLMPPPTTRLGDLRQHAALARYRAEQWRRQNAGTLAFLVRLLIFLAKLLSLSWACWPYSFTSSTGASLVAIASLDLGVPGFARNHDIPRRDSDTSRLVNRGRRLSHTPDGMASDATRWQWNWRTSGMLLLLHFLVLWVASRYAALCAAARHGKWAAS